MPKCRSGWPTAKQAPSDQREADWGHSTDNKECGEQVFDNYRGPPMTLANMRENGVRSLCVTCELCHHEAVMNVEAFGDAVPVPSFDPRMVCTGCGVIGSFARPNWQGRAEQETLTGVPWR
jgi:hypothetical protein